MRVGVGACNESDPFLSGKQVAENAIEKGNMLRPDFVLAFCSGQLDHDEFFKGLKSVVGDEIPIVGGSAIGIITNDYLSYEGYPAGAAILQSDTPHCKVAAIGNLGKGEKLAGRDLAESLSDELAGRLLFILYDSIKVAATDVAPPVLNASAPLIEGIEDKLQPKIPIIGAGLVGDYAFSPTKQFCGSYVSSQSVVGVMLTGDLTPYFRIMHGCTPLDGIYRRITRIEGSAIHELDGRPIVEILDGLYGNQDWRKHYPNNFLTIGLNHGKRFGEFKEGNYVNRLITGILPNGEGVGIFEPDLGPGIEIQFMIRDSAQMIESAKSNSAELMEEIEADGKRPVFGIYIDCAGRAAGYLNAPSEEASEVQAVFRKYNAPLLGFYSGVEIAPLLGKSRGLDWTGVLMILGGT